MNPKLHTARQPYGDLVVVQYESKRLRDNYHGPERGVWGIVLSHGSRATNVHKGDRVYISEFAGQLIFEDEDTTEVVLVREHEIMGIAEEGES